MAIVKCGHGHFYDDEKYTTCPMCQAKTDDIPKSVALFANSGDDSKTIGINLKNNKIDPVVGWLVCTDGPEMGRDYRLHTGRNFIGRDYSNDIALSQDESISRKNAGYVIYEPHKNFFMIMNGESAAVYVNGKSADSPTTITEDDEIAIGNCSFALVAYCKGGRKW